MAKGGSRYGAGRPATQGKAEQLQRIDIRDLDRRNLLRGITFTWSWTNSYSGESTGSVTIDAAQTDIQVRYTMEGQFKAQRFAIERTHCHFGGTRPWLRCDRCACRAAVIYMRARRFSCRQCASVAYSSQSEDALGRTWRKQQKLEAKLDPDGARPKGMRLATFRRLRAGIGECEMARELALYDYIDRSGLLKWL